MAAIAYPMPDPWAAPRPLRPVPPGAHTGLEWPDPRVSQPVPPTLPEARVYRRRRAVALLALVAALFVAAAALRLAQAGPGGGALTTAGSSGVAAPAPAASPHIYVVQPGDTLWSIVVATGHRGDPRPVVDRLALQLNGRPLQPGQRVTLP